MRWGGGWWALSWEAKSGVELSLGVRERRRVEPQQHPVDEGETICSDRHLAHTHAKRRADCLDHLGFAAASCIAEWIAFAPAVSAEEPVAVGEVRQLREAPKFSKHSAQPRCFCFVFVQHRRRSQGVYLHDNLPGFLQLASKDNKVDACRQQLEDWNGEGGADEGETPPRSV